MLFANRSWGVIKDGLLGRNYFESRPKNGDNELLAMERLGLGSVIIGLSKFLYVLSKI